MQANNALYDLFRTLAKSKKLVQFHADIDCSPNSDLYLYYVLLSPICAASAEVQDFISKLTFKSPVLLKAIEETTGRLRKLRNLEEEIKLQAKLKNIPVADLERAQHTGWWSPDVLHLQEALECCQMATSAPRSRGMYKFEDEHGLAEVIRVVEQ
jgi:hypothetical protein